MASGGTSKERCKKSQCVFHLTVSQAWLPVFLPLISHSCAFPLPPEHRDSSRAPSPLPNPPATAQLSSSRRSTSCLVKSHDILVPMTEVRMAAATQLTWDHACEHSANCKILTRQMKRGYFTTLKLRAFYTPQIWDREGTISPPDPIPWGGGEGVHFLSLLTTVPFPRSVSIEVSWIQELRIQRKAQLLIDDPLLHNIKGLLPTLLGHRVSLNMKTINLPMSLLWQVRSYGFEMSTGHSICCVYND